MKTTRIQKHLDTVMGPRRVAAARTATRGRWRRCCWVEVRKQLGFTQTAVANAMGSVNPRSHSWNPRTTCNSARCGGWSRQLGGELDIVAKFGDRVDCPEWIRWADSYRVLIQPIHPPPTDLIRLSWTSR